MQTTKPRRQLSYLLGAAKDICLPTTFGLTKGILSMAMTLCLLAGVRETTNYIRKSTIAYDQAKEDFTKELSPQIEKDRKAFIEMAATNIYSLNKDSSIREQGIEVGREGEITVHGFSEDFQKKLMGTPFALKQGSEVYYPNNNEIIKRKSLNHLVENPEVVSAVKLPPVNKPLWGGLSVLLGIFAYTANYQINGAIARKAKQGYQKLKSFFEIQAS